MQSTVHTTTATEYLDNLIDDISIMLRYVRTTGLEIPPDLSEKISELVFQLQSNTEDDPPTKGKILNFKNNVDSDIETQSE